MLWGQMMIDRCVVLSGGTGEEREISLITGKEIEKTLKPVISHVVNIDSADENWLDKVQAFQPECTFIGLHGSSGENGEVQAILDEAGLLYTGSGVCASQIAMDKIASKNMIKAAGFTVPELSIWQNQDESPLPLPVVVKPSTSGSSFGVSLVKQEAEFKPACTYAKQFGHVMIETMITGVDVCVPIVGEHRLPPIAIHTSSEFYDYEAKYQSQNNHYQIGAGMTSQMQEHAMNMGRQIFDILGCTGWGRVDFILSDDNELYFLEMNTVPGMTQMSLVPKSAESVGLSFQSLLLEIISLAMQKVSKPVS